MPRDDDPTVTRDDTSGSARSVAPGVPGFEFIRELGRGGMGVVYLARDLKLSREVALKVLSAGAHADEGALARLKAEAEAVAAISHPNVVHINEIGEHAGLPWLSLE